MSLHEDSVTQIIGTNGMGKSSIPLIIEEALYNKNSKGIKKADIPNRYIDKGYSICLQFDKDKDSYEVSINRKSSVKLKLLKNGEDISSHTATNTYKSIQEIIGVDFKTFSQLVYQNTNASLQFLTATDTTRKKFLIDLLHLDNYVSYFEVFKEETREVGSKLATLSGQMSMVENWLDSNKLKDSDVLPLINLDIETGKDEKEFHSLMEQVENISEKNKKIATNNTYKEMLGAINIDETQNLPPIEEKAYDDLQAEVGALQNSITYTSKLIAKIEATPDICNSCGQVIPKEKSLEKLEEYKKDRRLGQDRIALHRAEIEEIKKANKELIRRKRLQEEWESLFRGVDPSLPTQLLDKDSLEAELDNIEVRIRTAKKEIKRITEENNRRIKENTRIEVIKSQIGDMYEKLDVITREWESTRYLLTNLDVLKKAFSTNGLIAYKIENLVKELEELVNEYLAELSDGRFSLEFVVNNDKLNVEITDDTRVVDIASLSSGELARVNTATLLALRVLMSSISTSRINILFLDEVINVLDEVGREKLVEVLIKQELNTYVVSHGWTHPLLQKVEVVKKGNVSALEK
jgi:DNA repair exonuclease SbcCD ATPase subunit